jgi:hypothetical protein
LFLKTRELSRGKEEVAKPIGRAGALLVIRRYGYIGFRGRAADLGQLENYAQRVGLGSPSGHESAAEKIA